MFNALLQACRYDLWRSKFQSTLKVFEFKMGTA